MPDDAHQTTTCGVCSKPMNAESIYCSAPHGPPGTYIDGVLQLPPAVTALQPQLWKALRTARDRQYAREAKYRAALGKGNVA